MTEPATPEQIIEVARLAVETFFSGSDKTKRVIRFDMETLRGMILSYDAGKETRTINRSHA